MDAKKKIGILTFHRAINYGAVLQAFALQECLKNMIKDADIEFIDFYDANTYKVICVNSLKTFVKWCIKQIDGSRKRIIKFRRFVIRHLQLSKAHWTNNKDLLATPPEYDVYITGSDQVFNPYNRDYQVNFLGFKPSKPYKKIAYSASMGVNEFPKDKLDNIKTYLSDFSNISCRESQSVQYLSKLGFSSQWTVDPVFLLSSKEWTEKLNLITIKDRLGLPEKYIFVYDLNGKEKLMSYAYKLSDVTKLPIICLTSNFLQHYRVHKMFRGLGPDEFLACLSNASYVVTDSFHGTALSIVFRRSFFTLIAFERVKNRITSLLELLHLESRLLHEGYVFNKLKIEYSQEILEKLQTAIEDSKSYLKVAIEDKK